MIYQYWTYILESLSDNGFYIGHTNNLVARLDRHNRGYVRSTSHRRPWKFAYVKGFHSKSEAFKHEMDIKSKKSRALRLDLIQQHRESTLSILYQLNSKN